MDWWMLAYGSKLDIVPKLASVIAIVSHFSFFRLILLLAVQQKLNWSHKKKNVCILPLMLANISHTAVY